MSFYRRRHKLSEFTNLPFNTEKVGNTSNAKKQNITVWAGSRKVKKQIREESERLPLKRFVDTVISDRNHRLSSDDEKIKIEITEVISGSGDAPLSFSYLLNGSQKGKCTLNKLSKSSSPKKNKKAVSSSSSIVQTTFSHCAKKQRFFSSFSSQLTRLGLYTRNQVFPPKKRLIRAHKQQVKGMERMEKWLQSQGYPKDAQARKDLDSLLTSAKQVQSILSIPQTARKKEKLDTQIGNWKDAILNLTEESPPLHLSTGYMQGGRFQPTVLSFSKSSSRWELRYHNYDPTGTGALAQHDHHFSIPEDKGRDSSSDSPSPEEEAFATLLQGFFYNMTEINLSQTEGKKGLAKGKAVASLNLISQLKDSPIGSALPEGALKFLELAEGKESPDAPPSPFSNIETSPDPVGAVLFALIQSQGFQEKNVPSAPARLQEAGKGAPLLRWMTTMLEEALPENEKFSEREKAEMLNCYLEDYCTQVLHTWQPNRDDLTHCLELIGDAKKQLAESRLAPYKILSKNVLRSEKALKQNLKNIEARSAKKQNKAEKKRLKTALSIHHLSTLSLPDEISHIDVSTNVETNLKRLVGDIDLCKRAADKISNLDASEDSRFKKIQTELHDCLEKGLDPEIQGSNGLLTALRTLSTSLPPQGKKISDKNLEELLTKAIQKGAEHEPLIDVQQSLSEADGTLNKVQEATRTFRTQALPQLQQVPRQAALERCREFISPKDLEAIQNSQEEILSHTADKAIESAQAIDTILRQAAENVVEETWEQIQAQLAEKKPHAALPSENLTKEIIFRHLLTHQFCYSGAYTQWQLKQSYHAKEKAHLENAVTNRRANIQAFKEAYPNWKEFDQLEEELKEEEEKNQGKIKELGDCRPPLSQGDLHQAILASLEEKPNYQALQYLVTPPIQEAGALYLQKKEVDALSTDSEGLHFEPATPLSEEYKKLVQLPRRYQNVRTNTSLFGKATQTFEINLGLKPKTSVTETLEELKSRIENSCSGDEKEAYQQAVKKFEETWTNKRDAFNTQIDNIQREIGAKEKRRNPLQEERSPLCQDRDELLLQIEGQQLEELEKQVSNIETYLDFMEYDARHKNDLIEELAAIPAKNSGSTSSQKELDSSVSSGEAGEDLTTIVRFRFDQFRDRIYEIRYLNPLWLKCFRFSGNC